MDDIYTGIGAPEEKETEQKFGGGRRSRNRLITLDVDFKRISGDDAKFQNSVIAARDDLGANEWCAGMDNIFERQLSTIQGSVDRIVRVAYPLLPGERKDEVLRVVVKLELGYAFAEPGTNLDDKREVLATTVQLDVESVGANSIKYTVRNKTHKTRTPLKWMFFNQYKYAGCGDERDEFFAKADDSKGNYKYVITRVKAIFYQGRRTSAGCARDASHATTKICNGRIVQNIIAPRNMCVIASIRHAQNLTNPHAGIERLSCRKDHFNIFGETHKTTSLLPLSGDVLERLGDYYNTDVAIVGEVDKLVSKSRDSVVTLHYEDGHVWLVIADDSGHCRVCNKQYTSVKWLAEHRRRCHRCSKCRRAHSRELNCGWCNVCQINHPTSLACNESRSEYYREYGTGSSDEAKLVVMKFNRANLQPTPKEEVLHFDIETVQYPSMSTQVAVNVEWAVRCGTDVPFGALVFFEDDPILYSIGVNGMCHALYTIGLLVKPPQRRLSGKAWRMYSAFGRDSMKVFVDFLKSSPTSYILNAYNGSRFDHIFLLREWQSQGLLVKDMAFQGSCPILGTLLTGEKKVKHTIWDVCRHLCGSLSTNAKAAGLAVSKESFTDFHLLVSDEAVEEHRVRLQKYCRMDVQVLALLYETTAAEVYSKFGVHIIDYVTTSHMTYSMAFLGSPTSAAQVRMEKLSQQKETSKTRALREQYAKYIQEHKDSSGKWDPISDIWVYRQPQLESVFRAALYGGRCYPTQPLYESSQLDAVRRGELKYDDVDDYVLDLDANSLYPHAMSMPMPTGELHEWDTDTPVPANLGIYFITYITNKKLMNSPLPSREKNGSLSWTLNDGEGWYTTVDIDNARRFGYEVKYVRGYYWENSVRCFQPYINYLYTAKDRMKQLKYTPNGGYSPALYNQLKLLLNGLWGKTSQRPVARDVKQVKKEEDLISFFEEHTNLQFVHFGAEASEVNYWVQGDAVDKEGKISKPVQIADFVLAWSRRIMLDVMDKVDPGLTTCSFLYTDTDSLFVKVTRDNKERLESMLGPHMGQLSNDLCDPKSGGKNGKVVRMVCPAPKAYSAEYILDNNKIDVSIHAKGIHTSFFSTHSTEIASALTGMIESRFEGADIQKTSFAWGSDGSVGGEDVEMKFTSEAPYMKKAGAMGGFGISHSHICRQLGKTQFNKRVFGMAEEMSVPLGYTA